MDESIFRTIRSPSGAQGFHAAHPLICLGLFRRVRVRLGDWLRLWRRGRREQALLARMDDHMLRDIGIGRAMIEDTATSFWRLRDPIGMGSVGARRGRRDNGASPDM
jgi:uncharacterized protein YjiS (DUF1127 family)